MVRAVEYTVLDFSTFFNVGSNPTDWGKVTTQTIMISLDLVPSSSNMENYSTAKYYEDLRSLNSAIYLTSSVGIFWFDGV